MKPAFSTNKHILWKELHMSFKKRALSCLLLLPILTACGEDTQVVAPTNLTATAVTAETIVNLAWSAGKGNPSDVSYRIYRAEASFGGAPRGDLSPKGRLSQRSTKYHMLAEVPATTPAEVKEMAWRDTDVTLGVEYFYRVSAFKGSLESKYSNLAKATAGYPGIEGARDNAPHPTAPAISIYPYQTGTSQVDSGDVDQNDVHTFAITAEPRHGTATIGEDGLVTYVPLDTGYKGTDTLTVEVTDLAGHTGTVEIPVAIDFVAVNNGLRKVPASLCGDGETRVSMSAIEPAPYTVLPYNTTVTITATVSYSVPTTTTIFLRANGPGDIASKTVNGCGETTITGTVTTPTSGTSLRLYLNQGSGILFYYPLDKASNLNSFAFKSTSLPPDAVISSPAYEFDGVVAYDIAEENVGATLQDQYVQVENWNDSLAYFGGWVSPVKRKDEYHVRMHGILECGQTEVVMEGYAQGDSGSDGYGYVEVPSIPPEITVENRLSDAVVNKIDTTMDLDIDDCLESAAAPRTVRFTPSADWFSVSPTQGTLPLTLSVTYKAAKIPVGNKVEGSLTIAPVDESFAPVRVPVSARGYDYALADYERLTLSGTDDGYASATLSFDFPFGASSSTRAIYPNTNGLIGIGGSTNKYQNAHGSFDQLAPDHYGFPLITPFWTDNNFGTYYNDAHEGIYFREVTDITGHHAEFLYWAWDSFHDIYTPQVMQVKLYPSGKWTVNYPQFTPIGWEDVGYYTETGMAELMSVWDLEPGREYTWGPIP